MTDFVRALMLRQQEEQQARKDPTYVQALLTGKAPSATAYATALGMGHNGDEALTAARELDQAAAQFFDNPPTDAPPAA